MRWVDISVGKKLYATFCTFILFFLITMGAMLFYLDIVNKDAEILSQPSKDGALLAAEVAHLQWAMNVQNFVLQQGKIPLSVPTDGRQCDFGKWFYGPQRQELEGYTVNTEGYIDFPTLGQLHIAGMTRNEVAEMLKGMLLQYMPDPIVTINFLNFNITVIGEVARPGNFKITGDRVSLLEALGMAGDMTEFGDRENVMVIRENAGVREVARLNIKSKKIFDSPYYYLQQNDVVVVDPIDARARETSAFQMNFPTIVSLGSFASSLAMLIYYITIVSGRY